MVPLFDKENGTIYTVMREERFREIQRNQAKRRKAHYVDALVQSFNFDLNTMRQYSLFEEPSFEEEEVKSIVEDIIEDFGIDKTIIKRYKTILFEEYHSELTAVRCCVLDSSLQVVEEEDWSVYITHRESVVVDTVNESSESNVSSIKLKDNAKDEGKHICAVGTTVMRTIETAVGTDGHLKEFDGWTNKFIFPPYDFSVANSMVTNFHLPLSTLLMLVAAYGGYDLVMEAYHTALKEDYRFGTYGDAMLILDK